MGGKKLQIVQILFDLGLLLGYEMLLWLRFLAPKVSCATVKSIFYSLRHSLGSYLAHCSLHTKNYYYFIFSIPSTSVPVERNGLGPNNPYHDTLSVTKLLFTSEQWLRSVGARILLLTGQEAASHS